MFSLNAQTIANPLRFDGLYESDCIIEDAESDQSYLRFYENGNVISVSTDCDGKATDLATWFYFENKEIEYPSIGKYKISGKKISLKITSVTGEIRYKGKITDDGQLKLKGKSSSNNYKFKEKYHFVKLTTLK